MKTSPLRVLVLVVAGIFAVGVLSLTPRIWSQLDGFMTTQKDSFVQQLERQVGLTFHYQSLSPNILEAFEFLGVEVSTPQGYTVVKAASVRLRWNWTAFLTGKLDDLVQRVQIINGSVELDPRLDGELLDRVRAYLAAPAQQGSIPPIEGFNVSLAWNSPTETLGLERGFFQFTREGSDYRLMFRGEVQAAFPTKGNLLKQVQGQFDGDLKTNPQFNVLSIQARTSRVTSNLLDLAPLHVQLRINPSEVELVKVQDSLPFDFRIRYDTQTQETSIGVTADHFQPSQLIVWKQSEVVSKLLATTLTGQFSLQLSNDLKAWAFQANGEAGLPSGLDSTGLLLESSVVRGKVNAVPGVVTFQETSFESPVLGASFDGTLSTDSWLPDGHLVLDHWTDQSFGTVSGSAELTRSGNTVNFTSDELRWQNLDFRTVTGWFERDGDLVAGSAEAFHDSQGLATRIVLGGKGSLVDQVFPVSFQVTDLPLSFAAQLAEGIHQTVNLPADLAAFVVQGKGSASFGPGSWSLLGLDVSFADPATPERTGQFSADFQNSLLRLKNGIFHWDGLDFTADLQADLQSSSLLSWQLQAGVWGQRFDVTGLYDVEGHRLSFSGSHGLAGWFVPQDGDVTLADWDGELKLDELLVPGGFKTGFHVTAQRRSSGLALQFDKADLEGVYPWNAEPFFLQTQGVIQGDAATFTSVSLRDSHNRLQGTVSGNWNLDFGTPWVGSLSLQGLDGTEAIDVGWNLSSWEVGQVTFTTTRLDLGRWISAPFRGRVAAKGNLELKGADSTWTVAATVSEAHWGDSPLGLKFNAEGSLTKAHLYQLQVALDPLAIADGTLDLDLGIRAWAATLPTTLRFGTNRWSAQVVNRGTWNAGTLSPSLSTGLKATQVALSGNKMPDWSLSASLDEGLWKLALDDGSASAEGDLDGRLVAQAKLPFPLQGHASGRLAGGKVQLQIEDARLDLALLRELPDKRLLNLKAGILSGSFVVAGLLTDPEITGKGSVAELVFDTPYIRQTIGPVTVNLEFLGRSLKIVPSNIGPSGQIWTLSGLAALDHLLPQEYQLSLETDVASSLPYSYLGMGIRADGIATGLLTVKGNPTSLILGGKMTAHDSVVSMAQGSYIPSGGDYFGINSDLTVVSGRNVEFVFPSQQFPVLRAVMATNQSLFIHWNEAVNDFALIGKLDLKTGELNYLNQTFTLREGSVTFNDDENGIDPRLVVRAELKTRTDTGPMTITLRGDSPLSKFSPRFTSDPYRTPEELQQLVGNTLSLPTDYAQTTGLKTALSLASDVGTSFLLKPFEESVKKNFSLDLFSVKTEILKKSLLGGNAPLGASDYLDNTRVFFGKYLGDDLFLQGSVAFRQNTVVSQQQTTPLLVEPEISMDFQTPFFGLNWTMQPQHPETLFVSDNTVTFKWVWSY